MSTVEPGNRQWPLHTAPLSVNASSPFSPTSTGRESHGPKEARNGLWSDDGSKDSLPSIAFLELDRAPKDTRPQDQVKSSTMASVTSSSSTPLVSPTNTSYPSRHHAADSYPFGNKPSAPSSGHISPRHAREDEKDQQLQQQQPQSQQPPQPQTQILQPPFHAQQQRQSLPSIHEALGNDTLPPYPPPPPPSASQPSHVATATPGIGSRPGIDGPSGPPNPFSNAPAPPTTAAPSSFLRDLRNGNTQDIQHQRSSIASVQSQESAARSIPSLSSGKSPTESSRTGNSSISSCSTSLEPPAGQAYVPSMASPTHYGPPYPQPSPYGGQLTPTQTPTLGYSSAASYDTRPAAWNHPMQAEEAQRTAARAGAPVAPYSESVKRHLEGYDVEASLNEIAEASQRTLEFSRSYASRVHLTNRSGSLVGSLPSLSEIDSLLQLHRRTSDALTRIRSTVLSQEHALAEQQRTQGRPFRDGYHADHPPMYAQEAKVPGGFASGDAKKRRGKAAPPGRCHSCNRAETPEWRRGPDGARTLCNACGLHYAKLTRKMGANKASALGSNFRPRNSVEMRS